MGPNLELTMRNTLSPALQRLSDALNTTETLMSTTVEITPLRVEISGRVDVNDPEFREQVSAEISKITNTIERVANAMGTEGRNALIPPPITTF